MILFNAKQLTQIIIDLFLLNPENLCFLVYSVIKIVRSNMNENKTDKKKKKEKRKKTQKQLNF